MGRIEWEPQFVNDKMCFACGKPAVVYWNGRIEISVCQRCTLEVLPSLIADACRLNSFWDAFHEFERRFWQCLAFRLLNHPSERRIE